MPTNFVLANVAFPPPLADLESNAGKPKLSYKNQWRIKHCADFINMPTTINLQEPLQSFKLQKGPKFPITKMERQLKIVEKMKGMEQRIQEYRKERRKVKESKRPELPF